jgi:beta-glucosidase
MSAFNALNGVSSSGNHFTLTEILHDEWKFPGFVVSDWKAVAQLVHHGLVPDEAVAAKLALTAGVDMEMVSTAYRDHLKDVVKRGDVPEKVVDTAVRRVVTVKFAKGLFDHPYRDDTLWKHAFLRPDAVALAREAAAKSCVLLKNSPGVLPISHQATNVAIIGPLAEDVDELVGSWASRAHTADIVSLADGIRAKLPANAVLSTARGSALSEDSKPRFHVGDYREIKEQVISGNDEIDKAVAAAKGADVVVMALGERRDWSGEDAARSTLDLPGRQMELFQAVAAVGKPVIVVLFNGRPLILTELQEKAAAILEAWQPGVQAGNGVADILFGDVPPTGRLTTSFPRSLGQLPVYYNHYNTGRPELGKYVDGSREPLYPFGFGLAYTTFEHGPVRLSSDTLEKGKTLSASVTVTNTGQVEGTETVQLYIRALSFSAGSRPVRELKGFQKAHLAPGESKTLTFRLPAHELGFFDGKGHWLVEPGKYQLWLARNAADAKPVEFQLK